MVSFDIKYYYWVISKSHFTFVVKISRKYYKNEKTCSCLASSHFPSLQSCLWIRFPIINWATGLTWTAVGERKPGLAGRWQEHRCLQLHPLERRRGRRKQCKHNWSDNYTKNLPVSAGSRKEAEPAISWNPSPLVRCTFTSRSHVLVLLSYHFANFCHIASGLFHANYVWMWAQPGNRWIKKLEELANLNLATEATGRSIVVFAGTLQ